MNITQKINLQSIVSRNPEIIHRPIENELVMMSIEQGMYFGLDKTGTQIWELLETQKKLMILLKFLLTVSMCRESNVNTTHLSF